LNVKSELVGLGCVIRNVEGFVVAAKCCVRKAVVDLVCAEAMAALVALKWPIFLLEGLPQMVYLMFGLRKCFCLFLQLLLETFWSLDYNGHFFLMRRYLSLKKKEKRKKCRLKGTQDRRRSRASLFYTFFFFVVFFLQVFSKEIGMGFVGLRAAFINREMIPTLISHNSPTTS
jgi:hypothetical protein